MKAAIRIVILAQALVYFVSSNLYWIIYDDLDKWFSRFSMSMIMCGFLGVMIHVNANKKED